MTDTYLTNLIQTLINQSITSLIPTGTILSYGGMYLDLNLDYINPPTGYLWCFGQTVEISSYPNLFNSIGHFYSYGSIIPSGQFKIPNLRGATLKGTQYNTLFDLQTSTLQPGEIQQCNVGRHSHKYRDRGAGSRNISSGVGATVANNTSNDFFTEGDSYHPDTNSLLDTDTRCNSVSVNYIIKY
jgi:microcystin-dependent protein